MNEEIYDVALQSTGAFVADYQDWKDSPPPEGDFSLGLDHWIGRLPLSVRGDTVFKACEPAGFNFNPVRQFGYRYAFCRKVEPTSSDYYSWDSTFALGVSLFLSRLIHPTTIARDYSARLFFNDGDLKTIVPGPTGGDGSHAFVVASTWRDWLSKSEAEQLRDCLSKYEVNAPDRVKRARKHIDHAFHAYYLDQRVASLVTSFESLLKVSPFRSTAQFKLRVPNLARLVGLTLTSDEAGLLYGDRSTFVHGAEASFAELSDELIEQYNRFEGALRLSLLKASTDPDFAKLFASDESVTRIFGK